MGIVNKKVARFPVYMETRMRAKSNWKETTSLPALVVGALSPAPKSRVKDLTGRAHWGNQEGVFPTSRSHRTTAK